MESLDEHFVRASSFVSSEIGTGVILVPIRQRAGDLEDVYTLNETAAYIWALVDGQHSVAEIRDAIVGEFEVDREEAEQDVLYFLSKLHAVGAVERA